MAAPLSVEPSPYGEGQKVEQVQQDTRALNREKAKAKAPAPAPAPPAANQGFAGPQNMLQVPNVPPTYEAPFKTEAQKNQEVATMFDILAEKSPTWQSIISSLRGE